MNCYRLSRSDEKFQSITCSMCALIPREGDIKRCVVREKQVLLKRGFRTIATGIQVGYLGLLEIIRHCKDVSRIREIATLGY